MKVIEPKVEIWEQPKGIEGIYKQIERAGRVCYKSEDHTTEDSAKPFVERMIASKHYAMLEHGTVYLSIPCNYNTETELLIDELFANRFTHKTGHGKMIKVVLTIAHLNHTPEDCRPENLRALCQRCHNRYDAKHRAETRKNNKK